ncbi:anthranilate phosphoribosyltransferase [Chelatococcus sambhunathii]|uniref:Anthranilate phosphoribosyltransferase n=1 Tax=Chelatococcus sambhunathii TaxID=363953 RepID=A0ABU1DE00_9HYPH|nr:anthranilate phosphoribosyltransferase [Chelatococcus sambhunathii]MDR4306170.1 anthranilate phosphoribosyltransferase [Chelatococcus sambhunathii]
MDTFKQVIAHVAEGRSLDRAEAEAAFGQIMSGETTPAQIGAFLMALRLRGETIDEIAGAVAAMRARMTPVSAPANAVDVVGTGGDGAGSVNVSTCAAFVVAGCGVPVAKHGNRALSSKSGSADVLKALGVEVDLSPRRIGECISEAGIGFMFAPNHHSAMRHVGPARAELGVRTIFNLLGPLANPAGVTRQMVGVFARKWVEPIAEALAQLGSERAWVVHGSDGLDEITVSGPTAVSELKDGAVRSFEISPADAGLPEHPKGSLAGGDAEANAAALRAVLDGAKGAYRDVAILNAAATLVVAGLAESFADGAEHAAAALDSGAAYSRLDALVRVSTREEAA